MQTLDEEVKPDLTGQDEDFACHIFVMVCLFTVYVVCR